VAPVTDLSSVSVTSAGEDREWAHILECRVAVSEVTSHQPLDARLGRLRDLAGAIWQHSRDLVRRSLLVQRNGQVRLDDGCDVPRPHHGSMAAEVDDFAIGNVERVIVARVTAGPYPKGVMSCIQGRIDRFVHFE